MRHITCDTPWLEFHFGAGYAKILLYKLTKVVKRKVVNMTTLTHTHTPNLGAVSLVVDVYSSTQYTFCMECENNIERFYIDDDYDSCLLYTSDAADE